MAAEPAGALLTLDPRGRILALDAAAERLLGRADLPGTALHELFLDPAQARARHEEALREGAVRDRVLELQRPDGRVTGVRYEATPLPGGAGHVRVALRDLRAERLALDAAVRERDARLRSLFDDAPVAMVESSLDGRTLRVNDALCRLLDRPRAELLGEDPYGPEPGSALEDVREGRAPSATLERRCARADGAHVWTATKVVLTRDATGAPCGLLGVVEDISTRKRAEAARGESEERFRAAFEQATVGVAEATLAGRFLRANARFCELTGHAEEELRARTFLELTHPDDRAMTAERVRRLLSGEERTYAVEKRYVRADGATTWVAVDVALVRDPEGTPSHFLAVVQGLDACRAAERERRLLTERLQLATAVAQVGVWELDLKAGALTWDDTMFALYGRDRASFVPSDEGWAASVHPDDLAAVRGQVERTLRGEGDLAMAFRIVRPDGAVRHLSAKGRLLRDERGAPARLLGANRDVTAEVEAAALLTARAAALTRSNDELRESERRLRRVLDAMPVLLQAFDDRLRPVHWNEECRRVTGYAAEEIVGDERAEERLFPDPAYRERLARERAALKDDFRDHEVRVRCKDGSERLIAWSSVAARAPIPGWARWMVGVDVTGLRAAEASARRILHAIEQADESIIITDPRCTIEYANPAAARVSGWTVEELVGQSSRVMNSGAQDRGFYERLWRTITAGEVWRGTFTNKTRDGRRFQEAAVIAPVRDDHGQIVNFVAVKRCLAREQELEAQLRQAQKLDAVGQLAGGVAHDFNNALTGVIGFCELAQAMATTPKLAGYLRAIRLAGDRAAGIARQLLVFSRRQVMDLRVVTLNEVVEPLVKMLRRFLGEELSLEWDLAPDLAPCALDVGQVEQVLTNLCLNARDAMAGSGRLTIATANVAAPEVPPLAAPAQAPAGWVRLSVQDEGCGMTDEVRAHLFEPFFTTKPRGKGTGLGLAIVHGIVAKHAGAIAVDSAPGRGTTFRIYLPATRAAAAVIASQPPSPVPGGAETVLVVDDDEAARQVAGEVLTRLGYRALVAATPLEAIAIAEQPGLGVDALLTDVVMPRMSGQALAAALRRAHPRLRVLFMSGHVMETLEQRAIPPESLILKPFTTERLGLKLREALDARLPGETRVTDPAAPAST